MSKIAFILLLFFSYLSGYTYGDHPGEHEQPPRGIVSITRGITPGGDDSNDCNFAGNIVLGGFFSLEPDDKFYTIGSHQLSAYNLVIDQINRYQCGATLKEYDSNDKLVERNYALELRIYDDQSSITGSSAVAEMLARDPSVDIMVGGYSSTLTDPFAEAAHYFSDKLFLAAGASSTKIYAGKDLAFGLLPPSTKYLSLAMEALATVHGAKTLATVWEHASFAQIACGSAPELAEKFGMAITSATEVTKTPNTTVLDPIAESLKEEDPDVVITCVYDCNPWVQAMRRANWSPKAQVFTICVGQEQFSQEAGSDTEYIMGVTPWDPTLQVKDSVTGWSAGEFASRFRKACKEEESADVPYQAAMAASLISMLHQAIEAVNGFRQNGPQLAEYISKHSFQTMGGELSFDTNGQLDAPSLTIQYDTNGQVQTVYPPEAASGPMLYPMPTWDHRDCVKMSECEGESGNSTSNSFEMGNTCDSSGMCICGDPSNFRSVGSGATANCIEWEEMNYIDNRLKILSWVLVGLIWAFCIYCLVWTFYYRENSLVKVSQPLFLAFVVAGSALSIASILPMGVEAGYREDTDNIQAVDAACMAKKWLWGMGFAIQYAALFAKVWRVHKLYKLSSKMRRMSVDYKDVFYIMIVVVAAEVSILASFQASSPLTWQREVIEDVNGYPVESMGRCTSDNSFSWQCILMTFNVICLFIALVLCWRTKDLPSDFSESNYIFLSVMFMFQILLIAIPITTMVQDDANVSFFVSTGGKFLQNFTVLMLIFVPKMRRIYMGEDTTKSIKDAIAIDISMRRESMYRTSATRSRFHDSNSKCQDSFGSALNFDDSFRQPELLKGGSTRAANGSSLDVSFTRTNKTADSNDEDIIDCDDVEVPDSPLQDYQVQISKDDGRKLASLGVSWRFEASSGGSSESDCN